jgi:hypothetical protein
MVPRPAVHKLPPGGSQQTPVQESCRGLVQTTAGAGSRPLTESFCCFFRLFVHIPGCCCVLWHPTVEGATRELILYGAFGGQDGTAAPGLRQPQLRLTLPPRALLPLTRAAHHINHVIADTVRTCLSVRGRTCPPVPPNVGQGAGELRPASPLLQRCGGTRAKLRLEGYWVQCRFRGWGRAQRPGPRRGTGDIAAEPQPTARQHSMHGGSVRRGLLPRTRKRGGNSMACREPEHLNALKQRLRRESQAPQTHAADWGK